MAVTEELGDLSQYSNTYFKNADGGIISQIKRRGLILALSAPPGTGKTTITRLLLETDKYLQLITSCTTRKMREGEVDGVHYNFYDKPSFEAGITENAFLEINNLVGEYYGTPKAPVLEHLSTGLDVMLEIEKNGVVQIKKQVPEDVVSIFLLPPDWKEMERRLRNREGRDEEARVLKRLERAKEEMTHYPEYDYVIINIDIEKTLKKVLTILYAERMKRRRLVGVEGFVDEMLRVAEAS